jgi:hypothetical protein
MATVQHRLIIRHPRHPAFLLVAEAGRLRLPAFASEDRHTAEVDYINQAVGQRYGLPTTVLRSLRHSDPRGALVVRVHELQAHGGEASLPPGVCWYGRHDAAARTDGEDADAIAEWLADGAARAVQEHDRDWTQPGWLDEARSWIERALADAGVHEVHEIVQRRAWMSSCVLLVRTGAGAFYFKAVAESLRRECAVTGYLARHFPDAVAPVVATQPDRRWLLMRALPGRCLEEIGDVSAWERAAGMYAGLQLACVTRVPELGALGCGTRGLDVLAAEIDTLTTDLVALQAGEPDGLSAAEVDRLQARAPDLRRRCERLAADGLPSTLDHGDLWPANFFVGDATCAIIDWEDVAIGHPFTGLASLIVGLSLFQPALASREAVRRLERVYLARFEGLAPAPRLRESLRLAGPLGFVEMAARYRSQRPSVLRLHPWMRDLVPQTLRHALTRLDDEEA